MLTILIIVRMQLPITSMICDISIPHRVSSRLPLNLSFLKLRRFTWSWNIWPVASCTIACSSNGSTKRRTSSLTGTPCFFFTPKGVYFGESKNLVNAQKVHSGMNSKQESIIKKINVFRLLTSFYKVVFGLRGLGNDTYAVSTIWILCKVFKVVRMISCPWFYYTSLSHRQKEMAAKTAKQMLLAVRSSQGHPRCGVAMFDVCSWYLCYHSQSVRYWYCRRLHRHHHQQSIINHQSS